MAFSNLTTGQWNALGSAGAGLISGAFALGGTALQNKYNREMQERQNEYNLEMWNKQNEYNSPQAQMQRFQEAGLSPQLIYGQGSNGNATSVPEKNAPAQDMAGYFNKVGAALNTAKAFLDLSKQREELSQARTKSWFDRLTVNDYAAKLSAMSALGGQTERYLPDFNYSPNYPSYTQLDKYYEKQFEAGLSKSLGQSRYWDFRGNLAEHGLSEKDHFLWRFLTANAPETMSGIFDTITSLDSIVGEGVNGLRRFLGF